MSWLTLGHSDLKRLLTYTAVNGTEHHAYLLTGPPSTGRFRLCQDIARLFNCNKGRDEGFAEPCGSCDPCRKIAAKNHPDFKIIGDTKVPTIGIDSIQSMLQTAALKPFGGRKRTFVIKNAERLTLEAVNALLKTLEEPHSYTVITLTTTSPEVLPRTVVSRCQPLRLKPFGEVEMKALGAELQEQNEVDEEDVTLALRIARGRPGVLIRILNDFAALEHTKQALARGAKLPDCDLGQRFKIAEELASWWRHDRGRLTEELVLWASIWRAKIAEQKSYTQAEVAIRNWVAIADTLKALESNANPQLALDVLATMSISPLAGRR